MNIVSSICTEVIPDTVNPQLTFLNQKDQHIVYWKCVAVFFATSVRCNPHANHYLFTNEIDGANIENVDIIKFLKSLNVNVINLPFKRFKPSNKISTDFVKAFYKLDVIYEMSQLKGASIICDSDCLWIQKNEDFNKLIDKNLFLYDVYPRDDVNDKGVQNLSRSDIGNFFKSLNKDYSCKYPRHFGGEIVAGNQNHFEKIAKGLEESFDYILNNYPHSIRLPNGRKFFDGMEYFSSYTYNNLNLDWKDASSFIQRIWTLNNITEISKELMNLTIWHLPSEKANGFALIFNEIMDKESRFWNVDISTFRNYLGEFVGIPERKQHFKKRSLFKTLIPKLRNKYIIYKNRYL